ncbi:hypothetical protein M427DRAFT_39731 [Gonapodya prolifera JEL478]|uniref:Uncharacterized protein n=1 Tax=Gonapodya prolifera (strain JEL478) TaxID=1344416 RepID=A0A138ZWY6_GONPJ|nr:hypothetical protein M427DRAFT_39731 [Gonapodya prolifera JEL478]|eukprot:KXS09007.1 hypothetical protein M427DRAFT_39731 [Gonapodya prolifera JEL478]
MEWRMGCNGLKDVMKDFEGTSHVKQIGNWITVAKSYSAIPNLDSILHEDAINNQPNFHLPITILYTKGGVKKYLVDKDPELAGCQDGEKYLVWIKGISLLQAQDGWTDEAKLKAHNLILSDNFKDTATRAQVIEECKTRLGIVSKKGKEKEPHSTVNAPPPLSRPRSEVLSDMASDIPMELPDGPESETGQRTPKRSKPKATRGPPLVHPFTLPTITLIDLQTLEDALKEFSMEHGQTADLVILDFLLQDHADQRSLILTPKGILMEPHTGQSKKEASNNGTIFSATNAVA